MADNVKSQAIADLNSVPAVVPTAAEGAAGRLFHVSGVVAATAAGLADTDSVYRVVRIPTHAKVKQVEVFSDVALDTNTTQTLAISVNLAFSDNIADGTPAGYAGLLPSSAKDGTVVAATHTNRNKLFGTITMSGNNLPIRRQTVTFGDLEPNAQAGQDVSGTNFKADDANKPLWAIFNFKNGLGQLQNPGGKFDILLKVETAAATAQAGNIYVAVTYAE